MNDINEQYNYFVWKQSYVKSQYENYKRIMSETQAMKRALQDVGELLTP